MPTSRLDLIPVTNAQNPRVLATDYFSTATKELNEEVRNDTVLAYSIQPVFENAPDSDTVYSPDYLDSDEFQLAIGLPDEPPTGGTFALQVGATTSGLDALAYNITGAALQTALNAALTTEAEPLCTVTLIDTGVYQIDAASDGAIASGFFAVDSTALLVPECSAYFSEQSLGGASSRYQVMLVLVQNPMCYSEPDTELDPTGVTLTTVQAGSGTANKIQKVAFDVENTYGGSFSVAALANAVTSTCGICRPGMSSDEFGLALAVHPEIFYQDTDPETNPDNVRVTKVSGSFLVEFIGTLGLDNTPGLTAVADIDLVGPQGKSGTINLNTIALYKYSRLTEAETFALKCSITRTRLTGEVKTLLLDEITIAKEIVDRASMVPTPRPDYYTKTETDALLADKQDLDATLTAISGEGTSGTGAVLRAVGYSGRQAGEILTSDGAVSVTSGITFLEKTSIGAFTIAAPSSSDQTRKTIFANTDFAHVVTFTGATLLDGTTGANTTATFAAFKGASITVVARGAFWLLESSNQVTIAP